jgi:Fe-S-cluster-containing hydrogenase component 2
MRAPAVTDLLADAPVSLSRPACLTVQRPDRPCTACATACPENAIEISARNVSIQPMSCSGCALCASACPTGAIEVSGFSPANRLECARVRKTDGAAVPCLGGATAAMLRAALKGGDVVLVDRGWCAECPVSDGRAAPWADTLATVNLEMAALGVPQRVTVEHSPLARWRALPAPGPATDDPGRRALFNQLAAGGRTGAGPAMLPEKVRTPGPARRLAALTRLATDKPVPRALFPAFRIGDASADLASVAQLCPTSALSVDDTEAHRALIFDPAACIACGACTDTGALRHVPDPEGAFSGPETVAIQTRATCTRCRARFSPKMGQKTCGACARDTDLAALAHGLMRRNAHQNNSI